MNGQLPSPAGFHHLTAVSADIRANRHFYTDTLGLRLVKRSVNQDDTSAYHLFYADKNGTPGTDITFFDWPAPPERRGGRSITRTGFRVKNADALAFWEQRFSERGVKQSGIGERDGRPCLDFEDGEGQRLSLVPDDGSGPPAVPWEDSPVPVDMQLRGLAAVTITVPAPGGTDLLLRHVLGMEKSRDYPGPAGSDEHVHVYSMGDGGLHGELHVATNPGLAPARPGAGGVHHVAFRLKTDEDYAAWAQHLNRAGIPNSGKVDRFWFRSLYFRDPSGILFELATDGPGFTVDEAPETLGEKLILPPFLEGERSEIEAGLKDID